MSSEILINRGFGETRIARLENGDLVEFHIERDEERGIVGNIYQGRVTRVLPGMQAAFLEIGLARTGFLHASNILDPDSPTEVEDDKFDDEKEREQEEAELQTFKKSVPAIEKLIREGQMLLTQVIKAPMGSKGARLTSIVSIPGRFLVYLPHSEHIGISRRIEDNEERSRLKQIIEKHKPKQGGLIARTVASGATEKHLKDDLDYLVKLWGSIKKQGQKQKSQGLIHSDLDLSLKILRDRVTEDVQRIVVDDFALFKQMSKFIQSFLPRFKKRVELHTDKTPLFEVSGVEAEINRGIARKVWLKSGGYIVIDETEALTSIDVNTGRFVGKRNLEDTILQTNLEAMKEIAYQIRLRNLGGIIVLDFIDMERQQNRERIYQALLEELEKDPVRTHVLPISSFGLIEMTRKRTQESLKNRMTSPCGYCEGRGYLKSQKSLAFEILRACEKEASQSAQGGALTLYCHPHVAEYFAEDGRSLIEDIEKKISRPLAVKIDSNLHAEDYEIFAREL